jgi:hypothetical protein
MHAFMPDQVVHGLFLYDEAPAVFRVDLLRQFWSEVRDDDPKLLALISERHWVSKKEDLFNTIPMILHGDGVEYVDGDSLEVLSIGPLLGTGHSMDCMFLLGAFPYSCTIKGQTWSEPLKEMVNSVIKGLMEGVVLDMDGNVKCDLTASGYRFVIWSVTGDAEHNAIFSSFLIGVAMPGARAAMPIKRYQGKMA